MLEINIKTENFTILCMISNPKIWNGIKISRIGVKIVDFNYQEEFYAKILGGNKRQFDAI